jgi:polyhydroxyalkanoate synthesis regulator phasin
MDTGRMAKQMIDFHKATFDNTFNAMVMLQDQTEKMVNTFLAQATWLPEEGKRVIDEWLTAYKKGREDFRKLADDNFKKVDDFFATTGKAKKETKKEVKKEAKAA